MIHVAKIQYFLATTEHFLPYVVNDPQFGNLCKSAKHVDNFLTLCKGTAPIEKSNNPTAQEFAESMTKVREEVGAALKKAAEDMKKNYDRKHSQSYSFKEGDKVWLEGTNITADCPMKKLGNKRFRPFTVQKKVGTSSYQLNIPKTWKNIHNGFNEVLLTPYHPPELPNQPCNTWPPPEVVGKELEFEVEQIVDSWKGRGGKITYKVEWKGYGPHKITWEPILNLKNAQEALNDFRKRYPNKPHGKEIWKIEIPMSIFSKELLRPIPQPLTKSIPTTEPTEAMVLKFNTCGTHILKRG